MKKGKLIAVEGINRCGKTSALRNILPIKNVELVSEMDSHAGQLLRNMTKEQRDASGPYAVALLFAAARHQTLETHKHMLWDGITLLFDRYVWSSIAYNGPRCAHNTTWVKEINAHALKPDHVILLDLPARVAAKREGHSTAPTQFLPDTAIHVQAREEYRKLAQKYLDATTIINATKDPATVAQELRYALEAQL